MSMYLTPKWIFMAAVLLLAGSLHAQLNAPRKLAWHYVLPELQITISNNFLSGHYRYSDNDISIPYREDSLECYGGLVTISILQKDAHTQLKLHSGHFFRDTGKTIAPALQLKDLRIRVERNDTLLRAGILNETAVPFADTSVYRTDGKPVLPSRLIVNDSLRVGDVLSVAFSTLQGKPVLFFRIKRKWAYTRPFLSGLRTDSISNGINFIHQGFPATDEWLRTYSHADWPPPGLELNNREFKTGSNLLFNFRRESEKNDSLYLFRLNSSRQKEQEWIKTDGKILIPSLLHNTRYQLEIKYANGKGGVSVYTFHTPAYWYQTRWFILLSGVILISTILVSWLLYVGKRNKRRIQQQKLEMQVVYSQINPHFIFNAMSSIQGLMNDGQIEKANIYLTGFAGLLRASILHARKEWVPLVSEMKSMESYIALEALRFNFSYSLSVTPDIPDDIMMPPLLAQPLIENAVKHGVAGLGEAGKLNISLTREQNDIVFLIKDNGQGFDITAIDNGQGILLTNDRITLFNKIYQPLSIALTFEHEAGGMTCIVRYKNWLDE